jgi:hypothetical protein
MERRSWDSCSIKRFLSGGIVIRKLSSPGRLGPEHPSLASFFPEGLQASVACQANLLIYQQFATAKRAGN